MSRKQIRRQTLLDLGYEDLKFFERSDYDSAIIGVDSDNRVVYDYDKMVEHLMVNDGMEEDDAIDYVDFNPIRSLPYEKNAPIVIHNHEADFEFAERERAYSFHPEVEVERIVEWIRDWYDRNGPGCTAVVGLSGGKDSTIAAALCVKALGKDRVIGVALPDTLQGLNDADKIAEYLGITFLNLPIGNACWHLKNSKEAAGQAFKWSDQAVQNIPPRIRMAMLYAVAQTFNGRVVGTCNLSENYIGYFTKYGDGASDFEPLGNLTVTEVKAIGRVLGLPIEWVDKVPDDGLPNSCPDEEKLGYSYAMLDDYIRFGRCEIPEVKEKIDAMHKKNAFKLRPVEFYKPTWES